jgi:hypothetical protein
VSAKRREDLTQRTRRKSTEDTEKKREEHRPFGFAQDELKPVLLGEGKIIPWKTRDRVVVARSNPDRRFRCSVAATY